MSLMDDLKELVAKQLPQVPEEEVVISLTHICKGCNKQRVWVWECLTIVLPQYKKQSNIYENFKQRSNQQCPIMKSLMI